MSGKQSTGATRCWERALRKQPYLQKDIKKVSVTITVDALGGVTNVRIDGMPSDDGGLAGCLQSLIHGWQVPSRPVVGRHHGEVLDGLSVRRVNGSTSTEPCFARPSVP